MALTAADPGFRRVELAGDWDLWPDFAVRSTGFGAEGLDVFGPGDEPARLRALATRPRFREAVAWQSRDALRGAVDKLDRPGGRARREETVAAYWQRYCAKNDTIGFFGPLGWGRFGAASEAAVRAGNSEARRAVHLETWAVEALGRALGDDRPLPMDPHPEQALRERLAAHPEGQAALDRLESARAVVAAARGDAVAPALDALDREFMALTGRPAVRREDDSGGGRTIAYLDCARDLDLVLPPAVLEELRLSLPPVLEAARWWCGRVRARGAAALGAIAEAGPDRLEASLGRMMAAGFELHAHLGDDQRELQRRFKRVMQGGGDGAAERAAAAFADHEPGWPWATYHSADVQVAAPDFDAIARRDFLAVLGDFHAGDNPLAQGLFAHGHPIPGEVAARTARELGGRVELLPPRHGPIEMTARMFPIYGPEDVLITTQDEPVPAGAHRVALHELRLDGQDVVDDAGSFRVPLVDLLYLPIFVSALRTFDLVDDHVAGRLMLGRTVVRRARWTVPAADAAAGACEGVGGSFARRARERGLPRRVFARTPLERKPMLVDLESPVLLRLLARWAATTERRAPGTQLVLTEMLPGPYDCWLADAHGRHTSELRLVAVDRTRLAARAPAAAELNGPIRIRT